MPAYALPGTEVGPRRARILGVGAVAVLLLIVIVWRVLPANRPADEIRIALLTGHVGEGVAPGTDVRLDGVKVGSVAAVDMTAPGRQRIALDLRRSQLFGLTDALTIDYVPGNLFGITALQLNSTTGGTALRNGTTVDLTDRDADRVRDATLASLLESTGQLTDDVLTPKLTQLLRTTSRDISAFTPLLQAIGTTARSFTETQQLPPSFLFDQWGSALHGVPALLAGAAELLHADLTNPQLATKANVDRFADMFNRVQNEMLPVATDTLYTAQRWFGGLMPVVIPILDQVAGSVSDPQRSEAELSELLARLGAAFHDSPSGPVLNARVDLATVPGLATPLAALLAHQPAGSR
ncbi:Mce family protein MceA [Nocardia nova SH22a]|uniref:Mce family protein MceA n=1 Tax=Nocardia nova SH22a TaxID=1415166 RepID=W5TK10_9NOCA|nr:MlaD family protein [Nocardia nova]AHH19562.1 Mce family protein MceA [Nocardia nova SH22a]